MIDLLRILAVLALVGANAFFVIGEYAVVTARRSAIQTRQGRGVAAALRLMDDPVRVISTVQVGITALGILTGAVGEPLVRDVLPEGLPDWTAFVLGFSIITYLSVVLGELVPKALTLDRAERLAVFVAIPVEAMSIVLKPVVWVLQASAQVLLRPFGVTEVMAGDSIRSSEELRALVDEAEGSGVIARDQEELLHNVIDFERREARDVMVPAADVDWLDADLTVRDGLEQAIALPHSRYPVARGSLQHLVGVAHVRDLVTLDRQGTASTETASHPAPMVPPNKPLGQLMRELREQRQHLAFVGDEYGGLLGIVTLEDILEELVGEIEDEYDVPAAGLERIDARTYLADGSMTIDDFNDAAGTGLPDDGPHTLGGLIFDDLGRRPLKGDFAVIGDTTLRIEAVDSARITQVRVTLPLGGCA